jgi:hypothetical protein
MPALHVHPLPDRKPSSIVNLQLQNAAMIAWREITLARGQTQAYCVRRRYRAFVSSGFSSAGISARARLRSSAILPGDAGDSSNNTKSKEPRRFPCRSFENPWLQRAPIISLSLSLSLSLRVVAQKAKSGHLSRSGPVLDQHS